MPFIAIDPGDGRPRIPTGVGYSEEVECPICGGVMRVRGGEYRARHFYHPPESGESCETPLHIQMKAIALVKLKEVYPASTVDIEIRANDVPRRADVYVEFEQPMYPLGRGIAVEVQHLNDQKDIAAATADYLLDGSSVMWLFEDNYVGTRPEYDDVDLPDPIPVWPFAVPRGDMGADTASEDYLGITEADLIDVLPNHVDGQISLTDFPSLPKITTDDQTKELPEWSRIKEINLNLSIATPGMKHVHRCWVESIIENDLGKHRERIQNQWQTAKLGDRRTYLNKRFSEGDGDTFEFSLGLHPTQSGHIYIRQFSEGETFEIETSIGDEDIEGLVELLTQINYQMECEFQNSSNSQMDSSPAKSHLCGFSYTISRKEKNVVVEITEPKRYQEVKPTLLPLTFCDQHIPKLHELCQELMVWRDISDT